MINFDATNKENTQVVSTHLTNKSNTDKNYMLCNTKNNFKMEKLRTLYTWNTVFTKGSCNNAK